MPRLIRAARDGGLAHRAARSAARRFFPAVIAATALVGLPASATEPVWRIAGANARRGQALIETAGCAACHTVPGVRGARGNVGPPLTRFGDRSTIAGMLPNEPKNLVTWLRHPQQVVPGNAMPDVGLDERDARDIAAYLYTLR
jgi:cytochrome c